MPPSTAAVTTSRAPGQSGSSSSSYPPSPTTENCSPPIDVVLTADLPAPVQAAAAYRSVKDRRGRVDAEGMSEKAAQALKATVGPRHIGSLLLLVAAAACAVAATTAWVSIRLQMEPGTWGPGPRPAPTTIGSVDQHATL